MGPPNSPTEQVEAILEDRGKKYGKFRDTAIISQLLYGMVMSGENYLKLDPVHKEALHMILLKISRIVNGDPNYEDNWVDISGYATLVMKHLKGE